MLHHTYSPERKPLEQNPRWYEKPSQILFARARENSPEDIVLTIRSLGNAWEPIVQVLFRRGGSVDLVLTGHFNPLLKVRGRRQRR